MPQAKNGKTTLMHYLCKVLAGMDPRLLAVQEDLGTIEAASKVVPKSLSAELAAVSAGLDGVSRELSLARGDTEDAEEAGGGGAAATERGRVFADALSAFLAHAEGEVRALARQYSHVVQAAEEVALYFGEDPVRPPCKPFTQTLGGHHSLDPRP